MNDVLRDQDQPHLFADRQGHLRRVGGRAGDRHIVRRVCVAVEVVEGPLPLEAVDLDRDTRMVGMR
jgi:hypothetical protein